jgi:radical SAM superfamily enzyme YgiQ (UPF0313 family)
VKVTFVLPDVYDYRNFDWKGWFHHGIGALSASLKQAGHTTSLLHIAQPPTEFDFVSRVTLEQPDLLAFSATTNSFESVAEWAGWIKRSGLKIPVIVGGVHVTLCPEEAINVPAIDMICVGEGEVPLTELCQRMEAEGDITQIGNLWVKRNGEIYANAPRPLLRELDQLPFPDRDVFAFSDLFNESQGMATMTASRGCPFDCAYCSNHAVREVLGRYHYVRFRSVDSVIAEAKHILAHHPGINAFHFDDDILFMKKSWSQEFAQRFSSEIGLPFTCNMRPDMIDEETVDLLKKAGCNRVIMGVESGNEYVRREMLNRKMSQAQIENAFRLCHDAGIKTKSNNILGLPNESVEAMLDTIKLDARLRPAEVARYIFYPYPNTKLHGVAQELGLLSGRTATDYVSDTILLHKSATRNQIIMFVRYFRLMSRMYQAVDRLPPLVADHALHLVDRLFTQRWLPLVTNPAYGALWYLYARRERFLSRARHGLNGLKSVVHSWNGLKNDAHGLREFWNRKHER